MLCKSSFNWYFWIQVSKWHLVMNGICQIFSDFWQRISCNSDSVESALKQSCWQSWRNEPNHLDSPSGCHIWLHICWSLQSHEPIDTGWWWFFWLSITWVKTLPSYEASPWSCNEVHKTIHRLNTDQPAATDYHWRWQNKVFKSKIRLDADFFIHPVSPPSTFDFKCSKDDDCIIQSSDTVRLWVECIQTKKSVHWTRLSRQQVTTTTGAGSRQHVAIPALVSDWKVSVCGCARVCV